MKNKRLFFIAILLASCVCGLFGCSDTSDETSTTYTPGDEVGSYYNVDYDDFSSLLYLKDTAEFTLTVAEDVVTGTYELENSALTFSYEELTIEAVYIDDSVEFSYGGEELTFVRKLDYTISYNTGDGSVIDDSTVLNGKTVDQPADPTLTDYQFLGWYTDEDYTTKYDFTTVVSSDLTLYARWAYAKGVSSEYTISFDLGYDESYPSMQTIGGYLYDLEDPTRDGYEFLGWWVSQYNTSDKISYMYHDGTKLDASVTFYALWVSTESTGQVLSAPQVDIQDGIITWDNILGASNYYVLITSDGKDVYSSIVTSNTVEFDFDDYDAGDYEVSVQAKAASEVNSSETVVRYYKNKALTQVSNFSIVDGYMLVFNNVDGATNYTVSVEYGDISYTIDNAMQTVFDFSSCKMVDGGIKFVVTASAKGYATSTSITYIYNRVLDSVEDFVMDDNTEILSWNVVENATSYTVTITDAEGTYVINVGNTTSVCLKEYVASVDGIDVSVVAKSSGYNSPEESEYVYDKTRLATPKDIVVSGSLITWSAIDDAESYEIIINGVSYYSDSEEMEFPEDIDLTTITSAVITVRAIGGENSLYSDFVTVVTSLEGELYYNNGKVYWPFIMNVESYEVMINGNSYGTVLYNATENVADIALTQAGINTVQVRYITITENGYYRSEWATVEVYAYEIMFDSNGGSDVDSIYVAMGDYFDFPVSETAGYDFAGWYLTNNASGLNNEYTNDRFVGTAGFTLYAAYTPKTYTITYVSEDGVTVLETAEVTYGEYYTLEVAQSTIGATFAGWYEMANGNGVQFTTDKGVSLSPYTRTEDVTVYANWGYFEYTYIGNGYSIAKGTSASKVTNLVIPAEYNGEPVIDISSYAFGYLDNLITVSIPNTVTTIYYNAFYSCDYIQAYDVYDAGEKDPRFSSYDGVLIDSDPLTSETVISLVPLTKTGVYYIPDVVTYLDTYSFYYTDYITEIVVPTSVKSIAEKAFIYCDGLTKVSFESNDATATTLSIADDAFYSCSLLKTVSLPDHYDNFNSNMYYSCALLTEFEFSDTNPYYTVEDYIIYNPSKTKLVYHPNTTVDIQWPEQLNTIGSYAFAENDNIKELVIPSQITTIESYAFYECDGMTSLTFAGGGSTGLDELTIESYAFYGCTYLVKVVFEDGSLVTQIGSYAFASCVNIDGITLPDTVLEIGDYAFNGDYDILYFTISETSMLTTLGESPFNGINKITELYIPQYLTNVEDSSFGGIDSLIDILVHEANESFKSEEGVLYDKDVTVILFYSKTKEGAFVVPSTVTSIGGGAFEEHYGITSITIPAGLTTIGDRAFYNCTNLTEVIFSSSTDEEVSLSIGSYAFYSCDVLSSILLPDRVNFIDTYAFAYCTKLENFSLPSNLVEISQRTFSGAGYSHIVIPASVQIIGTYAFSYCYDVTFAEDSTISTIDGYSFAYYYGKSFVIPGSVETVEGYSFNYSYYLSSVVFEEGDADLTIDAGAFANCTKISSLDIPARTIELGDSAFASLTGLTSVTFADGIRLTTLPSKVFYNCPLLTSIILPEGIEVIAEDAFYYSYFTTLEIPASVKTIENTAFDTSKVTSITFREGSQLTSIGEEAFSYCSSLKSIELPASLETLGDSAFAFCTSLENIIIDAANENFAFIDNVLYALEDGELKTIVLATINVDGEFVVAKTVTSISNSAFTYTKITKLSFESDTNIETIGSHAFYNNSYLVEVTIPASVKTIGGYVFYSCENIEKVTFEDGSSLTEIGAYAFKDLFLLSEIIIPSEVMTIGEGAFEDCHVLTSVTFESTDTLKSIYTSAFEDCYNLDNITLPNSITSIGADAFLNCYSLTEITIPATVESLDTSSFEGCDLLESVTVAAGNTRYTDVDGIVYSTDLKELVYYPYGRKGSFEVPNTVSVIAEGAFYYHPYITEITFQEGGTEDLVIGGSSTSAIGAFAYSSLESIILPYRLTSLGVDSFYYSASLTNIDMTACSQLTNIYRYTFYHSGITSITIPEGITSIDAYYSFGYCTNLLSVKFMSSDTLTTIGTYAFAYCYILSDITLPDSVNSIGAYAFKTSGGFELTIPSSLTSIASNAFRGSGITKVVGQEGLTTINTYAFYDCSNLTSVELPTTVSSIATYAFQNCTSLKEINIPAAVSSLSNYLFKSCTSLETVTFDGDISTIGSSTFYGCTALKSLELTDGLTSIGSSGFAYCESLESIEFPSSLTTIGTYAFQYCYSLKEVEVPSTVTSLGYYAFRYCEALEKITFPNTYTVLPTGVVYGCSNLTDVVLPNSLTAIPASFFYNCTALANITLPDSITTIGSSAFAYCESLVTINLPQSLETLSSNTFLGCLSLTNVEFPALLDSISDSSFKNCISLNNLTVNESNPYYVVVDGVLYDADFTEVIFCSPATTGVVDLPDSVEWVYDNAFANSNVSEVILHEGITVLGDGAFANCVNLTTITIPSTVVSYSSSGTAVIGFGDDMFYGCTSLENVYFTDGTSGILTIGEYAFEECTSLETITFPSHLGTFVNSSTTAYLTGYLAIGDYAFLGCTSLQTVKFSEESMYSITIGDYAFQDCINLQTVVFPNTLDTVSTSYYYSDSTSLYSIPSIGAGAFYNCMSLQSVDLPNDADYTITIHNEAFYNCDGLTSLVLTDTVADYYNAEKDATVPALGTDIIAECDNITSITLGANITSLDVSLLSNCSKLKEVVISVNNKYFVVEEEVVYDYEQTTLLFYPDYKTTEDFIFPVTVDTYPELIFDGNSYIKSITLSDELTDISYNSFGYMPNINEYKVSSENENYVVVDGVLYTKDMKTLVLYPTLKTDSSYTVPEGVEVISEYAFKFNQYLTSVSLPSTLKTVDYALAYVPNLEEITVSSDSTYFVVENGALYSANMKTLYQYAVGRTDTEFVIPAGVTFVVPFAFAMNESIEKLTIGKDVYFYYNGYLQVSRDYDGAFAYMYGLTEFVVDSENQYFATLDGVLYDIDYKIVFAYPISKTDTSFTTGETVVDIAGYAFADAKYLKEIHLHGSTRYMYTYAFAGLTSDVTVYMLEDTSISSYWYDFKDGTNECVVVLYEEPTDVE